MLNSLVEISSMISNEIDKKQRLIQLAIAMRNRRAPITDLSQLPAIWDVEAEVDWLVDGLIGKGSVTLLSADSGTGKSWLAYYIAGCVAHGKKALGRDTKQCKVLYVDGENPAFVAKRNLETMGISRTSDLMVWGGWCPDVPEGPAHDLIRKFARDHRGLIIYDSLVEFNPGEEQSSTETRAFMKRFRALANLGAAVLVLHNTGKAESSKEYRGSSDIKAAVDMAYLLKENEKREGKLGRLSLFNFKSRLAPGLELGLEFRPGVGFVNFGLPTREKDGLGMIRQIVEQNPGLNQSKIVKLAKERGIGKTQAEEILKENRDGTFRIEKGRGAEKLYYLAEEQAVAVEEPGAPEEEAVEFPEILSYTEQ